MSLDINDAVIEATARRLFTTDHLTPSWDEASPNLRETYRRKARDLAEDGLLTSELPTERLPVGQVRRSPDGKIVAVRFNRAVCPWSCTGGLCLDDDDVRDWPVLVPETDLDHRRTLPEGHVAVDVRRADHALLTWWANAPHGLLAQAGRAELARRDAEDSPATSPTDSTTR